MERQAPALLLEFFFGRQHREPGEIAPPLVFLALEIVLTLLPVAFGFFGAVYAVAALGLGAGFMTLSVRLQRSADRRAALRTYLFSLAYLALLFCAMVLDARL